MFGVRDQAEPAPVPTHFPDRLEQGHSAYATLLERIVQHHGELRRPVTESESLQLLWLWMQLSTVDPGGGAHVGYSTFCRHVRQGTEALCEILWRARSGDLMLQSGADDE